MSSRISGRKRNYMRKLHIMITGVHVNPPAHVSLSTEYSQRCPVNSGRTHVLAQKLLNSELSWPNQGLGPYTAATVGHRQLHRSPCGSNSAGSLNTKRIRQGLPDQEYMQGNGLQALKSEGVIQRFRVRGSMNKRLGPHTAAAGRRRFHRGPCESSSSLSLNTMPIR